MSEVTDFVNRALHSGFSTIIKNPSSNNSAIAAVVQLDLLAAALKSEAEPVAYRKRARCDNAFLRVPEGAFPTEFEVTVHLKLLRVFRDMRLHVMTCDGLFGVRNSAVIDGKSPASLRWKVYVSRAIERYTIWLESLPSDPPNGRQKLTGGRRYSLDERNLPPLDILLIWHVHMLNSRVYWEDMVRHGRQGVYTSMKFPWQAINRAIKPAEYKSQSWIYDPPVSATNDFERRALIPYSILEDKFKKLIVCPMCYTERIEVEWWNTRNSGWAQDGFAKTCPQCHFIIGPEELSGLKFVDDYQELITRFVPMKGSLLDYVGVTIHNKDSKVGLGNDLLHQLLEEYPTIRFAGEDIGTIKFLLEERLEQVSCLLESSADAAAQCDYTLNRILNRYSANYSEFGLDLQSAVAREFKFIDKMASLSYLSSPFREVTIGRALDRLLQFFALQRQYPDQVVRPPVDVEMAWHTFQLHPGAYLAVCFAVAGKLVDQTDVMKSEGILIENGDLNLLWVKSFSDDLVGYDGCTCAFCEAERMYCLQSQQRMPQSSLGKRVSAKLSGFALPEKKGGPHPRKFGVAVDRFYAAACKRAIANGFEGVVRLKPTEVDDTGRPIYSHPYYAFPMNEDNRSLHVTSIDRSLYLHRDQDEFSSDQSSSSSSSLLSSSAREKDKSFSFSPATSPLSSSPPVRGDQHVKGKVSGGKLEGGGGGGLTRSRSFKKLLKSTGKSVPSL